MPKYTPTREDLYNTDPCPICGNDIVDMDAETCSDFCDQQWRIFKEDFEQDMMDGLIDDPQTKNRKRKGQNPTGNRPGGDHPR
jgi:hypothetical protein